MTFHPRVQKLRALRSVATAPSSTTGAIIRNTLIPDFAIDLPSKAAVNLEFSFSGFCELMIKLEKHPITDELIDAELYYKTSLLISKMNAFYESEEKKQKVAYPQ